MTPAWKLICWKWDYDMPYPLTVDNYELIIAAVLVSQAIIKNRLEDTAKFMER